MLTWDETEDKKTQANIRIDFISFTFLFLTPMKSLVIFFNVFFLISGHKSCV